MDEMIRYIFGSLAADQEVFEELNERYKIMIS